MQTSISFQESLALAPSNTPAPATAKGERIVAAAHLLVPLLEQGTKIEAHALRDTMRCVFQTNDNEGLWQWKDAYEACEAALVIFLQKYLAAMRESAGAPRNVLPMLRTMADLIPTHTRRSEDSQAFQQFSTPLELAFIAAEAGAITQTDTVLEPSAGTGMLAVHAHALQAKLILNELAATRADMLAALFPSAPLSRFNAENIDDYLPRALQPSLVLMNPPFSAKANVTSKHQGIDALHIHTALKRLAPGGRLVAITGKGCIPSNPSYLDIFGKIGDLGQILFSASLGGRFFAKHGTAIETRITVIEKGSEHATPPAYHDDITDPALLLDLIQGSLPARSIPNIPALPDPAVSPIALLSTQKRRPATAAPAAKAPEPENITELDYHPREDAAQAPATSDNIYEPYRLDSIAIPGAKPHPSKLMQSAAMASVRPPVPTYRPHLPAKLIEDGILSDAQLETIILAGEAHSQYLSGKWLLGENPHTLHPAKDDDDTAITYRKGFFIGDGTGCGKGREAAGIILDNWLKGRRRALWISKNDELLEDAQRDWSDLGQEKLQIVLQGKFSPGKPIVLDEGILFTTYATLRSAGTNSKGSRLQQILDWLGRDFDGPIILDEAHALANASPGESERGKVSASLQGIAGLSLQNALPHARVTYVSATGATVVENLAYASRLGFWGGADFPFVTRAEFIQAMHAGGIPAMEVLARDAKALGLYTARTLSFEDVEVDMLEHALTDEQIRIYDAYAEAFQIIHHNLTDALDAANITSPEDGTLNGQAKSAAKGAFESNKQRFFNHLITSMKIPTLIKALQADLDRGHAPVIQLVTTSEALLKRRLALIPPSEWGDLNIDITPREYVLDYLHHAFPITLYETYSDEAGKLHSRPAMEDGQPIICRAAESLRDDMIESLSALPAVQSALDQIIQHFGTDIVAEVTGRSRRIVKKTGAHGRPVLAVENRSGSANLAETTAFMDDRKQILIFSDAGGTGRSYHAALTAANQRRRIHYVLEPGWKADAAIQGLGRTNRTHQASAPVCRPVATDVRGEKRFLSTIARRLDTLGAITKGQRQTGGQGLFRPEDNLESPYARTALNVFYQQIILGKIPECSLADFEDVTGLKLSIDLGAVRSEMPPMHTFLNRMLALKIEMQNALFAHLENILAGIIEHAISEGRYEIGLETITAHSLIVTKRQAIDRHKSGAETLLYEVERKNRTAPLTLERAIEIAFDAKAKFIRNEKSGTAALLVSAPSRTIEDGSVERRYRILRPMETDYLNETSLHLSSWKECDRETFEQLWAAQLAKIPEFVTSRLFIVTGLLLPIWNRLPSDHCHIYRFTTDDGEKVIGRPVSMADLANLGLTPSFEQPGEAYDHLNTGGFIDLAEGLSLRKVSVMYAPRIELTGFNDVSLPGLKTMGLTTEIIAYKLRLFVPMGDDANGILDKLFKRYPPR